MKTPREIANHHIELWLADEDNRSGRTLRERATDAILEALNSVKGRIPAPDGLASALREMAESDKFSANQSSFSETKARFEKRALYLTQAAEYLEANK